MHFVLDVPVTIFLFGLLKQATKEKHKLQASIDLANFLESRGRKRGTFLIDIVHWYPETASLTAKRQPQ